MTDLPSLKWTETGEGKPLVLLMGLGAAGDAWFPHVDVWQESFRCIAFDNPGTGQSPLSDQPLTTRNMASAVLTSVENANVDEFDVVGISMGACVAQELALMAPDRVNRLMLVAPWAHCDAATSNLFRLVSDVRQEATESTYNSLMHSLIWTPQWLNDNDVAMQKAMRETVSAPASTIREQALACRRHDTRDRLSAIIQPTLVTLGTGDRFIQPELSRAVASAIPRASLEIFETLGHVHHWEEVDRFNRLAKAWFQ